MDPKIEQALKTDRIIDITTIGRKTGRPRRIEIALVALEDGYVIAGSPNGKPRSWYANMRANPDFTVHVKKTAQADLPARARPVTDPAERREVISRMSQADPQRRDINIDEWVAVSPVVRVEFPAGAGEPGS